MDTEIRKYLIEEARIPGRTLSYEELNERFHLGYDFSYHIIEKRLGM
jgi:hypothetical protein